MDEIALKVKLQTCQDDLQYLKKKFEEEKQNIKLQIDPDLKAIHQARKEDYYTKILKREHEIEEINHQLNQQSYQQQREQLLGILNSGLIPPNVIESAYESTISHWPTDVERGLSDPVAILKQFKRMGRGGRQYSALQEFIAIIFQTTENEQVLDQLREWGQTYYPDCDWAEIAHQIQKVDEQQTKDYQPIIIVRLSLDEQKSTQEPGDKSYYRLQAWLIHDLNKYANEKTGFQTLVQSGSASLDSFIEDDIKIKIQPYLAEWLRVTKEVLPTCQKDPEFHVFLPKDLLSLDVDNWPLDLGESPRKLGCFYTLVICCNERSASTYPISDWKRLWENQRDCQALANQVFTAGSSEDIDDLIDILLDAVDAENIYGLKLTDAPDSTTGPDLFDELLNSGLPYAIWGRCTYEDICNASELDDILTKNQLSNLSTAVLRKRRRSRSRNYPSDQYIGHHLALLIDNPYLIPPKSA